MDNFEKQTGIKIDKTILKTKTREPVFLNFDRSMEYCEMFHKTKTMPPLNLHSWVSVYNLITGVDII